MELLESRIKFAEESGGSGVMLDMDSIERTAMQTAKNVGYIQGLNELVNITWG